MLTFSSAMAPYAGLVNAQRRVLDMNDVDSLKWQSLAERSAHPAAWLYALEARRLAAMEMRAARTHDVCLMVNERERRKLMELADPKCAAVVRTGVDLARYTVDDAATQRRTKPIVGIIGSMSYAPNVRSVNWFGRHVWPIVKQREPRAEWLIVGSRPVRSVRRWGRLPGVHVTGFGEEMRPYLQSMRVVANPVSEEIGVQTKLIETLAIGKPAVVTPPAAAGIHALDHHVTRLADDHERAARLAAALNERYQGCAVSHTNMVFVSLPDAEMTRLIAHLAEHDIAIRGPRWVTHLDIGDADVEQIVSAIKSS
ncbi:MAG: glycosyltransferase [Planctomycetes bacterium]|nr:glycosyltransferase [Planctomycetota bacterium]